MTSVSSSVSSSKAHSTMNLPELGSSEGAPEALTAEEKLRAKVDWDAMDEELGLHKGQAELVLNLLASGVTPQEVAHSQGFSELDMKHIVSNEVYVNTVRGCITARKALGESSNVLMDTIEHKTLLKVAEAVPNMNASEALATFRIINQAKRVVSDLSTKKGDMRLETLGKEEVELTVLPPTIPSFKINQQGGIYEVDGRSMETIDKNQLEHLFEAEDEALEVTLPALEEL